MSYNFQSILRAFDPKAVKVTVAGVNLVGFSEEKVTVERANNAWELNVGCDGEATRVKSNDLSGTITVTLQQTSPSNDFLTTVFYNDQNNDECVKIEIVDSSGKSKIVADKAWVEKMPDATYAKAHSDRQWVFRTNNVGYYLAGNYESEVESNRVVNPEGAVTFMDKDGSTPLGVNFDIGGTGEESWGGIEGCNAPGGQYPNPPEEGTQTEQGQTDADQTGEQGA
tara:strand:+ start:4385 stop:5059 length:675 start_codon:yes stop_codon:yes gene_type:complete